MINIHEKGEVVTVNHEGKKWKLPIDSVAIEGGKAWYRFEINPSNRFSVRAETVHELGFASDLLTCIVDMCEHATDTYWVSNGETLWERMVSIYEKHGGDMEALKVKFPEYF